MLLIPLAGAVPSTPDLSFSTASFAGQQNLTGPLLGLRIQQEAAANGEMNGFSPLLHLETTNKTAMAYAQTTVIPAIGGIDETLENARVAAQGSQTDVDVVIVPLAGSAPPVVHVQSTSQESTKSAVTELRETAYVDSTRQVLGSDVARSIASVGQVTSIRIEGTFATSIWSWNFTAGNHSIPTGSIRSNAQYDPVLGRELSAQTLEQVAQLTFYGGWLEFNTTSRLTFYSDDLSVQGTGSATYAGVDGILNSQDAELAVRGAYKLRQAWTDGTLFARFSDLQGSSQLNGQPVDLPTGSAKARPGTTIATPARGLSLWLTWGGGFVGLLLVSILLHGPMRSMRFRAIQRRFDDRDYVEVLTRIDPFTRRYRFSRNANLLKAVSLLSLLEYKEAGLFLNTLGPLDGPDPATQAFLRACASAGQAHDADAIQHLTDCFRLDPTYREEAKTVPALRGFLPYFDVETGGAA
ncbi:MAG: hypothetical protein WC876_02345 [Candidatus Thermoplasmatota archaeon]